ncbi:shikimate dehydrogenase [Streptococcus macacae]|uniref:Shikimate dehydrogenase (NADP(+)) n=1 Tax=Streptococcus macacae NCTC 11558 TaxID=764298 RepID=G5JZ13_9STRE|nr:shikimate dehydrogenase [Streptococcus macacae]EHJ52888.1 shikimate dehydrogenase [Streptococcus macacae NCTC 11558]SUN78268.1 shikimate 5-dehydrogenase [Streptococcus macacae NCTC 11558]
MQIDGYTRLAAVVAKPIKHSISPFIHNYAFNKTGVNGVYIAWEIPESDLAVTLENVKRYDMFGLNISMPYKQAVIPYLDEVTEAADLIGAVNTIVNQSGKLVGYNTDGLGFFKSLSAFADFEVKDKTMTILGGGGAATAIIAQAAINGAKHIHIFNQADFLEETKAKALQLSLKTGVHLEVFPVEDLKLIQEKVLQSDLLVNATSVGMDGQSMIINDKFTFPEQLMVADVIYQPFETPFLKLVRSRGLKAVNGLGMLLFQAAAAFELWTGIEMPSQDIWQALAEKYKTK